MAEGHHQGHRIIRGGIGINNHFARHGLKNSPFACLSSAGIIAKGAGLGSSDHLKALARLAAGAVDMYSLILIMHPRRNFTLILPPASTRILLQGLER
jgi:hypothetical protein